MSFFEGFDKIRYYIVLVAALFGLYLWASITGTKITGDDNELKEERRGHVPGSSFYHK